MSCLLNYFLPDYKLLHLESNYTNSYMSIFRKFNDSIERSAEQCIVIVEEYVESKRNSPLTVEEKENIRQCVNELRNSDNKVRGLVCKC